MKNILNIMLDTSTALRLLKSYIAKWEKFANHSTSEILKIDSIRLEYADNRFRSKQKGLRAQVESENSIENTVEHNIRGIDPANSLIRPMALLGPILGTNEMIERSNKKILIIGPRSENELFLYLSYGFRIENITCVDLISYSDTIEIGDMHNLRYNDKEFDIVICGWVLAYSKNQPLAISEMVRVTRSGGLIAIGSDVNSRSDKEKEGYSKQVLQEKGYELKSEGLSDSSKLKLLFETYTDKVIFDSYTDGNGRWNNIIVKIK